MNPLKNRQNKPSGTTLRSTRRPRALHLNLESLEGRQVPAVTFHGGPVIPHVQVESVYWGQDWNQPSNQANHQQLDDFLQKIVSSSYLSMLGEYGVGKGSFGKSDVVTSGGPMASQTVYEGDIQNMLIKEIQQGRLPESDGSQVYIVYLPPSVHSWLDQIPPGSLGHHCYFTMKFAHQVITIGGGGSIPVYTNDTVYYAVIPNPVGNGEGDNIKNFSPFFQQTAITSHELAEAITDPIIRSGWFDSDPNSSTFNDEIGDIANLQCSYFLDNGLFLVQREWSNFFNRSIVAPFDTTWEWTISAPTILFTGLTSFNGLNLSYEIMTNYTSASFCWELAPGDLAGWFTVS
jgi:hypothetical protein